MKLAEFIEDIERMPYATPAWVNELGTSSKGNRKLDIQLFTYEPSNVGDTIEYESGFYLVVDSEENVLYWVQTA